MEGLPRDALNVSHTSKRATRPWRPCAMWESPVDDTHRWGDDARPHAPETLSFKMCRMRKPKRSARVRQALFCTQAQISERLKRGVRRLAGSLKSPGGPPTCLHLRAPAPEPCRRPPRHTRNGRRLVDCYLKSSFCFGKGRQSDSFGLRHWLICSWLGQDSEARW